MFIQLTSAEFNFTCTFYSYSDYYECQVFGKGIYGRGEVVNLLSDHQYSRTDDSVTSLAFYQSTINFIPKNLFNKFKNIKWFECEICKLSELEQSNFLNAGNLEIFISPIGGITELKDNLFHHCEKLTKIELPGHEIKTIERNAFGGLKLLKYLYLYHNSINNLVAGTFDELTSLEELNLSHNKNEYLPADLFKFNSNLRNIKFWQNRLVVIGPTLLSHLNQLTFIDFERNECADFYKSGTSVDIISTFTEKTRDCTEDNRLVNKLSSKSAEVSQLSWTNQNLLHENTEFKKRNLQTEATIKSIQENSKKEIQKLTDKIIQLNSELNSLKLSKEFENIKIVNLEKNFDDCNRGLLKAKLENGNFLKTVGNLKQKIKKLENFENGFCRTEP